MALLGLRLSDLGLSLPRLSSLTFGFLESRKDKGTHKLYRLSYSAKKDVQEKDKQIAEVQTR